MKYLSLLSLLFLIACQVSLDKTPSAKAVAIQNNAFNEYWYSGKAEISSYHLEQARYGEIHKGHAVMVFVTEPFSKSKKVKLDNPSANPKDSEPVLKLNATRKFNTGIYPYSMMSSVFTPVNIQKAPHTLKVSASSQEWCGHTFMQLKEQKSSYSVEIESYFENEGDIDKKVAKNFLEDEIWTRIRISPATLPVGNIDLLPSTMFARLKHVDYQSFKANASLKAHSDQEEWMTYQVVYQGLNRSLTIHFTKTPTSFPFSASSLLIRCANCQIKSGFAFTDLDCFLVSKSL